MIDFPRHIITYQESCFASSVPLFPSLELLSEEVNLVLHNTQCDPIGGDSKDNRPSHAPKEIYLMG